MVTYLGRRLTGRYEVDEFGQDPLFTEHRWLPLIGTLARRWFRCETRGAHHLPRTGAGLLVANHAGPIPLDGMVLQSVVHAVSGRLPRMLAAKVVFATPFGNILARRIGATLACRPDAARLLAADHLVTVFPEGTRGPLKPYSRRYQLQRFGLGFAATAIAAGVPIVPVAIVGSEETYPNLVNVGFLARLIGMPNFPLTPLFPWFGLLGVVPLPVKWLIGFGAPIATDRWGADAAEDPEVVADLAAQVHAEVQQLLVDLLAERAVRPDGTRRRAEGRWG